MNLQVLTWLWNDPNYRFADVHKGYTASDVVRLFTQIKGHTKLPLDFVCITDKPAGLPSWIRPEPITDWMEQAGGCWRRLRLFHPDAAQWFGDRFVSLDLDLAITGDVTSIFERGEEFIGWAPLGNRRFRLNGSFLMMNAGARPYVWNLFSLDHPLLHNRHEYLDTDQAWMNMVLSPDEVALTQADGLYRYGEEISKRLKGKQPTNAKMIFFPGKWKHTSTKTLQLSPWIRQYFC